MNTKCPTRSTLALCVLGALSTGYSNQAEAFQLGQLQGASRIGEPLDAYINVLLGPADASKVTDVLVVPDFNYRDDPTMNAALSNIKAELVRNEYGNHYIKLTSTEILDLPVLAFRIKATNGNNTLIRSFSVAPSPALPAIVQAPRVTGRSRDLPATTTRRKSPIAATQAPVNAQQSTLSGNEYGPVKAGDTLWKIATQVAGAKAGAILNELFELNPHAFIDGDINKLKQGVTLSLPVDASAIASTVEQSVAIPAPEVQPSPLTEANPVASADAVIASDEVFEEPYVDGLAPSIAVSETAASSQENSQAPQANGVENIKIDTPANVSVSTAKLPVDWRTENPELADRLNNLSAKYAALRAKYAEQRASESSSVTEQNVAENLTQVSPAAPASIDTSVTTVVDEPMPVTSDAAPAELAVDAEPAIESAALTPEVAAPSRFQLPLWAIGLVGLAVLLGAGGYYANRLRQAAEAKRKEQLRKQQDNSLKEKMAKKAQHRVTMEDEVERMLQDRVEDPTSESEKTLKLNVDELMVEPEDALELDLAEEDSPEHKINDSIAHGRYSEAEELLREVIVDSPRNFSAKLRLAEVYYITERIDDFVEVSQDIHANHRPDISDDDWRRVMRMGKMIAPEQPPFSGPQSIMEDASAG